MKILMIGYYGYQNLGDDLFVKMLTSYFSQQDFIEKILILCQDKYYRENHSKLKFIQTEKLSPLQRLFLLIQVDAMLWGGGTLSLNSQPKSLSRQQTICRFLGKTFAFLGIGLEVMNSTSNLKSISRFFSNASFLYVRDQYSYDVAQNTLQINPLKLHLGGDLAFLNLGFYEPFQKTAIQATPQLKNLSFTGKHWWGEGRAEFYAQQLIPIIEKYNTIIHLIPAQIKTESNDNQFHEKLKNFLPSNQCEIHTWSHPEDYFKLLSQMDFHIGNRLHSIIAADLIGVPNIGIGSTGSKIDNYIIKTQTLSSQRVVDFMEPFSLEKVETILTHYKQPKAFILQESQAAQEGVQKFFQFNSKSSKH